MIYRRGGNGMKKLEIVIKGEEIEGPEETIN